MEVENAPLEDDVLNTKHGFQGVFLTTSDIVATQKQLAILPETQNVNILR